MERTAGIWTQALALGLGHQTLAGTLLQPHRLPPTAQKAQISVLGAIYATALAQGPALMTSKAGKQALLRQLSFPWWLPECFPRDPLPKRRTEARQ